MELSSTVLPTLPNDDRLWRLELVGPLVTQEGPQVPLRVRVWVVPVSWRFDLAHPLSRCVLSEEGRWIEVDLGALVEMHHGCLFRHQRLVQDVDYSPYIHDITVQRPRAFKGIPFAQAGTPHLSPKQFYVEPHAWLDRLPLFPGQITHMVGPDQKFRRRYRALFFGEALYQTFSFASSFLSVERLQITESALSTYLDLSRCTLDQDARHAKVTVMPGVPRDEAIFLAWRLWDAHYHRRVHVLPRYVIKEHQRQPAAPVCIVADYPTDDPITMTVIGKRVQTSDQSWHLLVYKVLSWTVKLPFDRIDVYYTKADERGTRVSHVGGAETATFRGRSRAPSGGTASLNLDHRSFPDRNQPRVQAERPLGDLSLRIPGLEIREVRDQRPVVHAPARPQDAEPSQDPMAYNTSPYPVTGEVPTVGGADIVSESGVETLEIPAQEHAEQPAEATKQPEQPDEPPGKQNERVDLELNRYLITLQTLPAYLRGPQVQVAEQPFWQPAPDDSDVKTSVLDNVGQLPAVVFPTQDSNKQGLPWARLFVSLARTLPRRCAILEFEVDGKKAYLFETERLIESEKYRYKLWMVTFRNPKPETQGLSSGDVRLILQTIAQKNGVLRLGYPELQLYIVVPLVHRYIYSPYSPVEGQPPLSDEAFALQNEVNLRQQAQRMIECVRGERNSLSGLQNLCEPVFPVTTGLSALSETHKAEDHDHAPSLIAAVEGDGVRLDPGPAESQEFEPSP